jgi:hypothetical protein
MALLETYPPGKEKYVGSVGGALSKWKEPDKLLPSYGLPAASIAFIFM